MLSLPSVILWEITYACPLRCTHCYSESGVRPSRQLSPDDMLRVASALVAWQPRVVHLSGGEPLIVRALPDVVACLATAGISVVLTTSGFGMTEKLARAIVPALHSIHVSVDGTDAATHDRIRGRAGSFDAAIETLALLDRLSAERRARGEPRLRFGIDFVVLRSTFDQLPRMVTDIAARYADLEFVIFNGVVPQGLASREGYESELLTDEQTAALEDEGFADALQASAPGRVVVAPRSNVDLRMHPELVREGTAWTLDRLIVEPDGLVRALEVYEGHVGNVLTDEPAAVWERVCARRDDEFVRAELAGVKDSAAWADATRRIDRRFASTDDLVRIARRRPYSPSRSDS